MTLGEKLSKLRKEYNYTQVTGIANIRDVIPFPRTTGTLA